MFRKRESPYTLKSNIWSYFFVFFFFQFNTLNNALARCPHCRKVSSVGPEFARGRGILFLALGIFFFIVAIVVTMGTYRYARVNTN